MQADTECKILVPLCLPPELHADVMDWYGWLAAWVCCFTIFDWQLLWHLSRYLHSCSGQSGRHTACWASSFTLTGYDRVGESGARLYVLPLPPRCFDSIYLNGRSDGIKLVCLLLCFTHVADVITFRLCHRRPGHSGFSFYVPWRRWANQITLIQQPSVFACECVCVCLWLGCVYVWVLCFGLHQGNQMTVMGFADTLGILK